MRDHSDVDKRHHSHPNLHRTSLISYNFHNPTCIYFRLDVKGCKQNLSSNIPTRNRSSSNAFQLAPYPSSTRGILERRTSQTPVSTLKIVRSVSRESIRSAHHCTCPCLNTPVSNLWHIHSIHDHFYTALCNNFQRQFFTCLIKAINFYFSV